jgi:ubiquinone/menaquinone biosynthesis C-methylase UbiE
MSNHRIAGTFDLVASTFDRVGPRFFSKSGSRLVELAQIPNGAKILDVATGRGAVLFPAAYRVGRSGLVIGVDLSGGMLREIATDAKGGNLSQVGLCHMDAEQLGFLDKWFDYVLCGHSIFYFPGALKSFFRVLKPGGQLGATVIKQGCLDWIFQVLDHHLPDPAQEENQEENDPDPAINTVEGLEKALELADFADIRIYQEESELVYRDEEQWWLSLNTLGVRASIEKMDPRAVKQLKAEMDDCIQPLKRSDGIHVLYQVLYALSAKKTHTLKLSG